MRRFIVIAVIAVLIVVGAAYFFLQPPKAVPNIRTAQIERGDLTLAVNATGNVAAEKTVNLSFDNPGLVAVVKVQEGQQVAAGDILAQQENTAQTLAVTQAQANADAAQLSLDQLLAPPSANDIAVAEATVKAAQQTYNSLLSTVDPNAITAAQLRLQQAQTAYQDAVQHRKDTGGQVPTTSPTYQLALAQEGQASFAVAIAQLQLQAASRGVDSRIISAAKAKITQAQAQLDQLKAGAPKIQIDRAQLAVDQAKTALDNAKSQLDNTILRAPFAGIISTVTIKAGALTVGGVPAMVLVDSSRLHVTLNVDEIDIGGVQTGQPVRLTLDALPGETLNGTVDRIALTANNSGSVISYDVQVGLEPTTAPVKIGMTASASIVVRDLPDVLRVPNLYVRLDRRTNLAYVNLVNPDKSLTEVQVTLGLRAEDYSEIVSGVNEDDTVGISLDSNFSVLGN